MRHLAVLWIVFLVGCRAGPAELTQSTIPSVAEKPPVTSPATQRPNFIIIMSDDSGYSDLGCFGGEIATPNIDALAARSYRFTALYTNGRCSPTRASLLTGHYPHDVGVGDLCRPRDETPFPGYRGYLASETPILAEILKAEGYATFLTGKWHLGGERGAERENPAPGELEKWPRQRGFDHFFGLIHGATGYFRPRKRRPLRLENALWTPPAKGFYLTDAISDDAVRCIDDMAGRSEPYFLYVAYTAPHAPLEARKKDIERLRPQYEDPVSVAKRRNRRLRELGLAEEGWKPPRIPEPKTVTKGLAKFAALMEGIDRGVGRIVDAVERSGTGERTVILYLSDNGAADPVYSISNIPFKGYKGTLHEGSIRTHGIFHVPSALLPGVPRAVAARGHVIDAVPTFLDVAGIAYPRTFRGTEVPPPDGVSWLPVLSGNESLEERPLFWELYGNRAVIQGKWKYHQRYGAQKPILIDLESNGIETRNLSDSYPDRVRELGALVDEWCEEHFVVDRREVLAAQTRNPEHPQYHPDLVKPRKDD